MTEKELKKLTRLEILELLLEQTKINEELKQEIQQLNSAQVSIESLERLSAQMNFTLSVMGTLVGDLNKFSEDGSDLIKKAEEAVALYRKAEADNNSHAEEKHDAELSRKHKSGDEDEKLYCRIIHFYTHTENAQHPLPADIMRDVRARLRDIIDEKK